MLAALIDMQVAQHGGHDPTKGLGFAVTTWVVPQAGFALELDAVQ